MKYMGSKRVMLQNGLGSILLEEAKSASRIVDLFSGSGFVSRFVATKIRVPVIACDLQKYAAVLAGSVIKRIRPVEALEVEHLWLSRAYQARHELWGWHQAEKLDTAKPCTESWQREAQELCALDVTASSSLVWRCYGGHYFSPTQALSLDAMILSLPDDNEFRELCLAATIIAASKCVAAPGHTAQPFKATPTAAKFLREAWLRDPFQYARSALKELCPLHALERGDTYVTNANDIAKQLRNEDAVFVDPPYSAVQYSRFYHVLETIARGACDRVEGVGRYPIPEERPNSSYSRKGLAKEAMKELLEILSEKGCTVILTFPKKECSNGLSGDTVAEMAQQQFHVKRRSVRTRFSTLGGNTRNRDARTPSDELILVLESG